MLAQAEDKFKATYGFYTTDLIAMHLTPKTALSKFGFSYASEPHPEVQNLDNTRKDLDAVKAAIPRLEINYSPVTRLDAIDFAKATVYCPDCTATATTFRAMAITNLDDDADLDIWTIDQNKKLVHVNNDLKAAE